MAAQDRRWTRIFETEISPLLDPLNRSSAMKFQRLIFQSWQDAGKAVAVYHQLGQTDAAMFWMNQIKASRQRYRKSLKAEDMLDALCDLALETFPPPGLGRVEGRARDILIERERREAESEALAPSRR